MPVPRYLPHLLSSTALTSISIHLLWQRKSAEEDRARANAHISILTDLVGQLRSGKSLEDDEIKRLRNLARIHNQPEPGTEGSGGGIRWTEVLWGRKAPEEQVVSDGWEQKDLEQLRREFEKSN
ncbi:hypothetical protein BJ138DRAFT_1115398 [Hygrophoropsis aurantiaca]|uniref:Uncharacterized protein n=1 Tax=Hygrophoropsis aurantiaca TaxID=72124 RepID=A0ACB8A669_9AGAM|nr:hypothetical protein BJ138DRAFT_1115398 [Hygrophoropsis aurantiaca]